MCDFQQNNPRDGMMKSKIKPGMTFMVENKIDESSSQKLGVNLQFDSMNDFEPAQIARQVPAMRKLLEAREHLANLQRYMSARPKAQEQIKELLNDPELLAVMAAQVEQKEAARDAQDDSEE
jgi:type VI secretion system protein ImpB